MLKPHHTKYLVGMLALGGVIALVGSITYYMQSALNTYAAAASATTIHTTAAFGATGATGAAGLSGLSTTGLTSTGLATTGMMSTTGTVVINAMSFGPTDLIIKKTAGTNIGMTGSMFKYLISYANSGTNAMTGIKITDTLPAGLIFVSSSPAPTSVVGSTLKWNIPILGPHNAGNIALVVKIAPTLASGTTINNAAHIVGIGTDINPANNNSHVIITIH